MLLQKLKSQPILFDASVLLVGIDKYDDKYSFDKMKLLYMEAVFNYFQEILIHETVMDELDESRNDFINKYVGYNVQIVSEGDLYGTDGHYTTIFNQIADFDLFKYKRHQKRDKGDVFSLAYAAYQGIPFISARDGSIIKAVEELSYLANVEVCGFEHLLLLGFLKNDSKEFTKSYKSIYKSYCTPAIKSGLIPKTFNEFVKKQKLK